MQLSDSGKILRFSLAGLLALALGACSGHHSGDHASGEPDADAVGLGSGGTGSEATGSEEGADDMGAGEAGAPGDEDGDGTVDEPGDGDAPDPAAALTGPAAVTALRAHVAEFMAKPEHEAETVKVQHLLVSFAGAGTRARRSQAEAEQLAADLWAQIQAGGADYDELIRKNTDDSPPGIYLMTSSAPTVPRVSYNRGGMVPAFGNAGWRLAVGEYGVAGFDRQTSPYGWHIVKRIE